MITMLAIVVIFGLGSTIDWTWFIPGTALPALVCAGWLAGRGPLERLPQRRRFKGLAPGAIFAVTGIVVITLALAWIMAQPMRSANADAAALSAATKGQLGTAIADARNARSEDPVSVDPLFELAAFDHANGDQNGALSELRTAVDLQPDNPTTWLQEGELLLSLRGPVDALPDLTKAAQLDRGSTVAASALAQANAELGRP
jgi:tetratricopeptide (TPR) repeat protein